MEQFRTNFKAKSAGSATLPPGLTLFPDGPAFRFYCPRADSVFVVLSKTYSHARPELVHPLIASGDGWWEGRLKGQYNGWYYGYRIHGTADSQKNQPLTEYPVADPWGRFWALENNYLQHPLTKIVQAPPFDWEGDSFLSPSDPRDLIIYECHIKDLIAHPSAQSRLGEKSAFSSFIHPGQTGGIEHLKRLGVNAVEFLPLQHFAYFEPPYLEATTDGVLNTWNFYGRNYWGYMTSNYFLPELLFASGTSGEGDSVADNAIQAVQEVKALVKELHKNGIAVLVDVVYNHISQYDLNPLKYADINYYLRKNGHGYFTSDSGCGNDLRSEATETRRLIVDSLKYWMTEFHVDGFRFDLAKILDWETVETIKDELRSINPYVILIAEPWGGGYDPQGFSHHDWAAWNDQIRNGVKGSDPEKDLGFIFGSWHHGTTRFALENYLTGTLNGRDGGRFYSTRHTVNYLESHDNHTLADFIRVGLNPKRAQTRVVELQQHQTLNSLELRLSKLAALYLFLSQGSTMIHAGQEMGRGKVVAATNVNDPATGYIDHNSYEKDNETNWIDFNLMDWNKPLITYYTGLIAIRKNAVALRRSSPSSFRFSSTSDALQLDAFLSGLETGDCFDYRIALNGSRTNPMLLHISTGFEFLADPESVWPEGRVSISGEFSLPPSSGVLLRRNRKFPN